MWGRRKEEWAAWLFAEGLEKVGETTIPDGEYNYTPDSPDLCKAAKRAIAAVKC